MLENTSSIYVQWNCTLFFLLNSHDNLLGSMELLLTSKYGDHLILSGQFLKLIELLGLLLKNLLRFFDLVMEYN